MQRALGERPARFDIVGMGEISVDDVLLYDRAPRWGGKARALRRERLGGGQVATAMAAARRLGLTSAIAGCVGDDESGRFAVADLEASGVDVTHVEVSPEITTHQAVVVVDGEGNRTVLWSEDDKGRATGAEVMNAAAERSLALAAEGRVLHVDGNQLTAACAFAARARAEARCVSCDLDRYEGQLTDTLLAATDICIVSMDFLGELGAALGVSKPRLIVRELQSRIAPRGIACVTLGEHGALAWDGEQFVEQSGFRRDRVVDTTACGDTFRAAFLAAWLDGVDLKQALRFANAAAALKTRDLGRRGCPTRQEVEALLRAVPQ